MADAVSARHQEDIIIPSQVVAMRDTMNATIRGTINKGLGLTDCGAHSDRLRSHNKKSEVPKQLT